MTEPLISVIVPVYNVEKYIERCLNSIANQTYTNLEIILVDDGSPDNCPVICDDWAKKDKRIKVIHKKNEGLAMARNSGLDIASGEYIAFCDSDDKISGEMYEKLYEATEEGKYDVVYSGFNAEQENKKWIDCNDFSQTMTFDAADKEELAASFIGETSITEGHRFVMSCNVALYRRCLLEKYHIRQISERKIASEDLIFQLQVALRISKVKFVPECYYYYYSNGSSLTHTFKESKFQATKNIREEMLKTMPASQRYKQLIDAEFYSRIRSLVTFLVCGTRESFSTKISILRRLCSMMDEIALDETKIKANSPKYWFMLPLIQKHHPLILMLFAYFDKYINKKNLFFWKKN